MTTLSLRACLTNIGEPKSSRFALWSNPSFGGRVPPSLRVAMAGMTDPHVSQWHWVGIALASENTNLSEESQGATTDGAHWYVSSNKSDCKRVVAFDNAGNRGATYEPTRAIMFALWQDDGAPNVDVGPDGIPLNFGGTYTARAGETYTIIAVWSPHFGAPCYHEGSIYVPIQLHDVRGVWSIKLDSGAQYWFKASGTSTEEALPDGGDLFAWCAFHPVTGILYTCNFKWPPRIRAYNLSGSSLFRSPDDDIPCGNDIDAHSLNLDRVQGGVFTADGRLVLVRCDFNAVFCLSSLNGHCFGALVLGDFGHDCSEVEAVTLRSFKVHGTRAQVHISELDNDWSSKDDFYLHSYQVPDAAKLSL